MRSRPAKNLASTSTLNGKSPSLNTDLLSNRANKIVLTGFGKHRENPWQHYGKEPERESTNNVAKFDDTVFFLLLGLDNQI